jgi:hypothetical protein
MKTRFDNRQLAHVWAQQSQPEGRGSNMFFEGAAIFSYGRHFKIAEFVTRNKARAVLFNTRRYSISTSRHVGYTASALHGLGVPVFHVPDIDDARRGGKATREYYAREIGAAELKAARARTAHGAQWEMQRASDFAHEANAYSAFFGLRWRVSIPAFSPERLEAIRNAAKREAARKAARTKAQQKRDAAELARRAAEYEAAREEWRRGESPRLPVHSSWSGNTMLRLSGDRIETSRGAWIPVSAARLVWDAVRHCKETGAGWAPLGADRPRIGEFTLDRVDAEGNISAGCHTIEYLELARMAVALGYEGVQS